MQGLYVITHHADKPQETLLQDVDDALLGGACVVQYRDKQSAREEKQRNALALASLCRERGALFIVNDDVELAQQTHADGVHLGEQDATLMAARAYLGPAKVIGVSCYGDIANARQAQSQGADYVAFGRFYPSTSKPQAAPCEPGILGQARRSIQIPVVAIGGITAENGAPLVEAGANMLAVIDGVFGQPDVMQAARRIAALFN